jgi:hypothetical protein
MGEPKNIGDQQNQDHRAENRTEKILTRRKGIDASSELADLDVL